MISVKLLDGSDNVFDGSSDLVDHGDGRRKRRQVDGAVERRSTELMQKQVEGCDCSEDRKIVR